MCGIVGVLSHKPVNQEIYDALTVLQHRGQDAAGMVTSDGASLNLRKGNGLVRDVFRQQHMQRLLDGSALVTFATPPRGLPVQLKRSLCM